MLLQAIISQYYDYDEFKKLYLDTNGKGSEGKPLDPFYSFQICFNPVEQHWFFSIITTGGVPNNRATIIYKVNHDLEIVGSYQLPLNETITSTYDTHPKATISFDSYGNTYFCREQGANGVTDSDGHNTNILLYKLNLGEDLSSMSLIKTINGFWSYPTIAVYNNVIYITARGDSSGLALDRYVVHKSTDFGITFSSYTVINTALGASARAYVSLVYNYDDNDILLALNTRNDTVGAYEAVYILRSSDGITWRNAENTFSKNISSSGAITISELDANLLIWKKPNDNYAVNFEGGVVKGGKIKLLISQSFVSPIIDNNNVYQTYENLRFYIFYGGVWKYNDLSDIIPKYYHLGGIERILQYCWDLNNDYIYIVDKTVPTVPLKEFYSQNQFENKIENKIEDLKTNYYFGSHSFNANLNIDRLLILYDIKGVWNNFNDYANLKLYAPK